MASVLHCIFGIIPWVGFYHRMNMGVAMVAHMLLRPVSAMRTRSLMDADEVDVVKRILGVPVYNYHRAFETGSTQEIVNLESSLVESNASKLVAGMETRGEWLVFLEPNATDSEVHRLCTLHGRCRVEGHAGGVPFVRITSSERELGILLGHLSSENISVEFIEPDLRTRLIPDNNSELLRSDEEQLFETMDRKPGVGGQRMRMAMARKSGSRSWGLDRIGVSRRQQRGHGVHVYVFDTGVRTSHKDFGGRAIPTLDVTLMAWAGFSTDQARACKDVKHQFPHCAQDREGHGTHTAGTIGGEQLGVAPEATIHAVKVLTDDGGGLSSWIVTALDWVIKNFERPAVVSMSLGTKGKSEAERKAISLATKQGITVVVAAGNENTDACRVTPASAPAAITVGSTDPRDFRSEFSNYGRCVDLFAPGSYITSLGHQHDKHLVTQSGTSMACPHVSGAAALILEAQPKMSPENVRRHLLDTAETGAIRAGLTSLDQNLLLAVEPVTDGVKIKMIGAFDLPNDEWLTWFGKQPSPYCVCMIPGKARSKIITPAIDNTVNAAWDYEAVLFGFQYGDVVSCEVWNSNLGHDSILGNVTFQPKIPGFETEDFRLANAPGDHTGAFLRLGLVVPEPSEENTARCCCEQDGRHCRVVEESEQKFSLNPFSFGELRCPDPLKHVARFHFSKTPDGCIAPSLLVR